jgi:hypothetical protein
MMPTPDGHGFHNVEPTTREVRALQGNKEALEKARLRQRGFDSPANILVPLESSPGYATEYERFNRGAAAAEHSRRVHNITQREVRHRDSPTKGCGANSGAGTCPLAGTKAVGLTGLGMIEEPAGTGQQGDAKLGQGAGVPGRPAWSRMARMASPHAPD